MSKSERKREKRRATILSGGTVSLLLIDLCAFVVAANKIKLLVLCCLVVQMSLANQSHTKTIVIGCYTIATNHKPANKSQFYTITIVLFQLRESVTLTNLPKNLNGKHALFVYKQVEVLFLTLRSE